MPHFEFAPAEVSTSIEVLPKDLYDLKIESAKTFLKEGVKGTNYGIRYTLVVAEGPCKGKKSFVSCYMHTDGGKQMAKRFLMAAYGFDNSGEDEKKFNEQHAGADWTFNTDDNQMGEVWTHLIGKHIIGDFDVKMNTETGQQQQQQNFRPAR